MIEKIKTFICDYLSINPESFDVNTNFRTSMEIDSLTFIGLIVALENEFDIDINEDELKKLETVGDLIAYMESKENK